MELPAWQERIAEAESAEVSAQARVSFYESKRFFAVDQSGSTIGAIMNAQAQVVKGLHTSTKDTVTKWDHVCENPQNLAMIPSGYFFGTGGTNPASILRNDDAVREILGSEFWILLTDGDISPSYVTELTQLAEQIAVLQVPVILVITGPRRAIPADANISVGIPFFASAREALILFRDSNTASNCLYIIDAKGVFAPLKPRTSDMSSWEALPTFATEADLVKACGEISIMFDSHDQRQPCQSAISLGPEWDELTHVLVDVPKLLAQQQVRFMDLHNLLNEEAFAQLALVCKTRGQTSALRDFLLRHKQQEVVVRLEDRHGASEIMNMMQSPTSEERKDLMERLRKAHAANRETYASIRNSPGKEAQRATELNRIINRSLATLSDFEKSSYTAEILSRKSNRAMRAQVVSAADAEVHLSALDLSDEVKAFRGFCTICCGDQEIMSIVLKKFDTVEENTSDFALNSPLAAAQAKQNKDMISSQCVCFQCALLMPKSIYQEEIVATLPTIDCDGVNRRYVYHQLTLAVTAGLATGASGIMQLFLTILDRTLETKEWCSSDNLKDPEVVSRRKVLTWVLNNLLQRCKCRENFTETGDWVDYPKALQWAVKDYESAGLDSWIIQYPVAGFSQLLRWYELLKLPIEMKTIESMKAVKLMHLTITNIMNGILHQKDNERSWTRPFMELIYAQSNAPAVPRDLGPASTISAQVFWSKLKLALGSLADVERFLTYLGTDTRDAVAERVQLLAFWALFAQKGHTTPKTFFANIKAREPLAPALLDPTATVPHEAVQDILTSVFCTRPMNSMSNVLLHLSEKMPPFVTPFGPSVLYCSVPGCGEKFYSEDDLKSPDTMPMKLRENRASHFKQNYAALDTLMSDTGLPEATVAPKAPTSYHNCLHVSTARVWSRLEHKRKCKIRNAMEEGYKDAAVVADFVADVKVEICAKNRRGNIYSATLDQEVVAVLPSFLFAVRKASERLELDNRRELGFVFDWELNRIKEKMEWELSM
ncbi:hypothetical protein MMC21_005350 [Puttea exsequens]|nr:hypothetical protein [Puttea exsequens]